jgi:uncharacterized protein YndB with AHSA1/START domain
MSPQPIVKEIELRATPEQVFDVWMRPEHLAQWFAQRATIDLRPGGTWTYDWPPHLQAKGRYLTVERPSHLFWTWDESIQDSRQGVDPAHAHPPVTLDDTMTAIDEGATRLHVVERGHADDAAAEMNERGVDQTLATLRAYLEEGRSIDWSTLPPQSE